MFKIEAPYPGPQVTTYLPSPLLGDSLNTVNTVNLQRTMTGGTRTYVKLKPRFKLVWDFRLDRGKYLELQQLYALFSAQQIRVTDWDDTQYVGYLISNPADFESRSGQTYNIQLEFEGSKWLAP